MKISRGLVAAVLLLVAMPGHAIVDCTGTTTNLSMQLDATGTVTLGLSSGPSYTYLCGINSDLANNVPAVVCRTMYASLMAAKLAGKRVLLRFNNYSTCAGVSNWDHAGTLSWNRLFFD